MKKIHFQSLFSQVPTLRKQFDFLQELMGTHYFEASIDSLPEFIKGNTLKAENPFTYYLISNYFSIKEKDTPVALQLNLPLSNDDLAIFISNAVHHNGHIMVNNKDIELLFPESPELTEDMNFLSEWKSLINEDWKDIDFSPVKGFLKVVQNYFDMTPEEQFLFIDKTEDSYFLSEIITYLKENKEIDVNIVSFIGEFIDHANINPKTLLSLDVLFNEEKREFSKTIKEKINKRIQDKIFSNPSSLITLWTYRDKNKKVPNHLWNIDTITHLSRQGFNIFSNSITCINNDWFLDIKNIEILNSVDVKERSDLLHNTFKQETFNHYADKGGEDFIKFISYNCFSDITMAAAKKDKNLFKNIDLFRKTFMQEPKKLKKIIDEISYDENVKILLRDDNPQDYINQGRETIALFSTILPPYIEKEEPHIIQKWLPFIFNTSFDEYRISILKKVDFNANKSNIYSDFCNNYNHHISKVYLNFIESHNPNASLQLIKKNPDMYTKELFEKYRNDKDKIIAFLNSPNNNKENLKYIPPVMFNDRGVAIKSIAKYKNDSLQFIPKEHFNNIEFIIPMLQAIKAFSDYDKSSFHNYLPEEIKFLIKKTPKGIDSADYIETYLQKTHLNKINNKTNESKSSNTEYSSFKL